MPPDYSLQITIEHGKIRRRNGRFRGHSHKSIRWVQCRLPTLTLASELRWSEGTAFAAFSAPDRVALNVLHTRSLSRIEGRGF